MTTVAPDATPRSAVRSPEPNLTETIIRLLADNNIPAESIHDVRRTLAAGQVYLNATEQVRVCGDGDTIAFFEALDVVVDHVADRRSLKPLRASFDKLNAEITAGAEPGHYPWCVPGECITQTWDDGETAIEHVGTALQPILLDGAGAKITLHAQLGSDEALFDDTPTVYLYADDGDALLLNTDRLDASIRELSAFVDGLRAMRRQMNQGRRS
ncbi:hypothetical protein CG740_37080 [Streptomyces sp. CB01201]|uniref:DUF6907 domain-containing protein n=1 Tax=Streptomyces sp. CB01201 TaxID=2020324 RepID=UPI000C278681|nr:hypothetical protein [Streptomyces sp. CB01201]PJM98101.1 hypothetical protein CG740_37080 [Streptomyces sp. CB01201]